MESRLKIEAFIPTQDGKNHVWTFINVDVSELRGNPEKVQAAMLDLVERCEQKAISHAQAQS